MAAAMKRGVGNDREGIASGWCGRKVDKAVTPLCREQGGTSACSGSGTARADRCRRANTAHKKWIELASARLNGNHNIEALRGEG